MKAAAENFASGVAAIAAAVGWRAIPADAAAPAPPPDGRNVAAANQAARPVKPPRVKAVSPRPPKTGKLAPLAPPKNHAIDLGGTGSE
ncbi:MAG TPA: hypothetical protein VFH22_08875 [Rhodocyclaceae bacterium]|nr:hypothetical protein [Rhodocyclaceae bacterium]